MEDDLGKNDRVNRVERGYVRVVEQVFRIHALIPSGPVAESE